MSKTQENINTPAYKWIGTIVSDKVSIIHVPSGLVFNTWKDTEKWDALLEFTKNKTF
jgi:hypothetical protein